LNLYGMALTRMDGLRPYRQSVNLAIGSNDNLRHQWHNLWSIRAPTRIEQHSLNIWRILGGALMTAGIVLIAMF
jgi:hypothetical protein